MSKITSEIIYARLLELAKSCQKLTTELPKNSFNQTYSSQLVRSSSSPGANYTEAIEASSTKDFIYRLKMSRKELRESIHWLSLIESSNKNIPIIARGISSLVQEAQELIKIFTASIITSEKNREIRKIKKRLEDDK